MTDEQKSLGAVVKKYADKYGINNSLNVYNMYAIKCIDKGIKCEKHEYIRKADRYMSYAFYMINK